MASPLPNLPHFLHCLDRQLDDLEKLTTPHQEGGSDSLALTNAKIIKIRGLIKNKEEKDPSSPQVNPELLELKECMHMLRRDHDTLPESVSKVAEQVLEHVTSIQGVLLHSTDKEEMQQVTLLSQPWMIKEMISLLKLGDKWAVEKLIELMQNRIIWAIEAFFNLMIESEEFAKALESFNRSPSFRELMENIFFEPELMRIFCELIEQKIKQKKLQQTFFDFISFVLIDQSADDYFYNYWIDKLLQDNATAISLFLSFFREFEDPEKLKRNPFFMALMNAAERYLEIEILFIIASEAFSKKDAIAALTREALVQSQAKKDPILQRKHEALQNACTFIVNDLLSFERISLEDLKLEYEESGIEGKMRTGDYFAYSEMSMNFRFSLIQGLMRRKVRLLNFTLHGTRPKELQDRVHDELQTDSRQILMCTNCREHPLVRSLAPWLHKEGYTIQIPAPDSIDFNALSYKALEGTDLIYGWLGPTVWVRDYVFEFEKSYRLPPFMQASPEEKYCIRRDRLYRLGLQPPYSQMGATRRDAPQLDLFEYLPLIDLKLGRDRKPVHFQSLYYEGGNTFMGHSRGHDYVVLGKDTLSLNKRILQYEFAELGLKWKDNEWTIVEPYMHLIKSENHFGGDPETLYQENNQVLSHIPDEHLLELMRMDFGGSEVHLVEQPDYHLDVACALYDSEHRRVFVNDSVESLRVMRRYIDQVNREKSLSREALAQIEERFEKFEERAKLMEPIERIVTKDFERQGFKVTRIPGMFREMQTENPEDHQINFFNHVPVKNKAGEPCLLALGCPPFFKALFEQIIHKYMPHIKEVIYADEEGSKALLERAGGLHCIMRYLM